MKYAGEYFKNIKPLALIEIKKHQIITLIGTTLLASFAGIDSFSWFADFTESYSEELRNDFEFPDGIPNNDTYLHERVIKEFSRFLYL
jgi:hypothetical protein